MIEATELTKRYGAKTAVDGLSFTVRPGVVTGFLGPNGAGQVDDDADDRRARRAERGRGDGRRRAATATCRAPLQRVGALLEARSIHPGRSAANHLLALAQTHGISRAARRRGDRPGRPAAGRPQARRHVLARHGPAARDRLGAARRPGHARARRAGQRPRPRGHPLDPHAAAQARRRGPHDLRLLAPDERDGADRRPPDRRRPRPRARRLLDGRLHRAGVARGRARALAARHPPARAAAGRGRDDRLRRAGRARGRRAEHRRDRRPRRRRRPHAARARPRATRRSRTRSWS